MRLVFFGTPEAAVPSLRALVAAGHEVLAVVTQPDRRRGRGNQLSPSPVKAAATALSIPVVHSVAELADVDAEWGIVVAYGAMIKPEVLAVLPMLNVHFSLLPRWRGAAPVERAILAGDAQTGVTIMTLEATLDTGTIHAEKRTSIGTKTAQALTAELAESGAQLLVEVLATPSRLGHARAQKGPATYAEKLTSDTFHLRPEIPVEDLERIVRLGKAWCTIAQKRVRVLEASGESTPATPGELVVRDGGVGLATGDGILWLTLVQPEGSTAMTAQSWWGGARLAPDATWG